MDHIATRLFMLADYIDAEVRPSRTSIASALSEILKIAAPPFRRPTTKTPPKAPVPSVDPFERSTLRFKILRDNPEFESFDTFAEFLTEQGREYYTLSEQENFIKANPGSRSRFEDEMLERGSVLAGTLILDATSFDEFEKELNKRSRRGYYFSEKDAFCYKNKTTEIKFENEMKRRGFEPLSERPMPKSKPIKEKTNVRSLEELRQEIDELKATKPYLSLLSWPARPPSGMTNLEYTKAVNRHIENNILPKLTSGQRAEFERIKSRGGLYASPAAILSKMLTLEDHFKNFVNYLLDQNPPRGYYSDERAEFCKVNKISDKQFQDLEDALNASGAEFGPELKRRFLGDVFLGRFKKFVKELEEKKTPELARRRAIRDFVLEERPEMKSLKDFGEYLEKKRRTYNENELEYLKAANPGLSTSTINTYLEKYLERPEMASFDAFVKFLEKQGRDRYFPSERADFIKMNPESKDTFDKEMAKREIWPETKKDPRAEMKVVEFDPKAELEKKETEQKEKRTELKKRVVPTNIEYRSYEDFAKSLSNNERDSYTVNERKNFCKLNGIEPSTFDTEMKGFNKYLNPGILKDGIYTPDEVVEMAADALGTDEVTIKRLIRAQDAPDRKNLVDVSTISELWNWFFDGEIQEAADSIGEDPEVILKFLEWARSSHPEVKFRNHTDIEELAIEYAEELDRVAGRTPARGQQASVYLYSLAHERESYDLASTYQYA